MQLIELVILCSLSEEETELHSISSCMLASFVATLFDLILSDADAAPFLVIFVSA